jgi:hypothetical protein
MGSKPLILYLLQKYKIEGNEGINEFAIFEYFCHYGHLELAQWLYRLEIERSSRSSSSSDRRFKKRLAFQDACLQGHSTVATWLYGLINNADINIQKDIDHAFRAACRTGQLNIAKWLYLLGDVNIHALNDNAFLQACKGGHIAVVQWLYSLDADLDIHINDDQAFISVCRIGHLELAQWLYATFFDVQHPLLFEILTEAFRGASKSGHITILQWLHQFGDVNYDLAYHYALQYQYQDILLQYQSTINPP